MGDISGGKQTEDHLRQAGQVCWVRAGKGGRRQLKADTGRTRSGQASPAVFGQLPLAQWRPHCQGRHLDPTMVRPAAWCRWYLPGQSSIGSLRHLARCEDLVRQSTSPEDRVPRVDFEEDSPNWGVYLRPKSSEVTQVLSLPRRMCRPWGSFIW